MGQHSLSGPRQPLPERPATRHRRARVRSGAGRRIAAPAALGALLIASGATTGTAFAGEGTSSGDRATDTSNCPDGTRKSGDGCLTSGRTSTGDSPVTGAGLVASALGTTGSTSAAPGSGTGTKSTSAKNTGTKGTGTKGTGTKGTGKKGTGKKGTGTTSKGATGTSTKNASGTGTSGTTGTSSKNQGTGSKQSATPKQSVAPKQAVTPANRNSTPRGTTATTPTGTAAGPLGAVPGLNNLTTGVGKAPNLTTATSGLTSVPAPSTTTAGLGSSVPGLSTAGNAVDSAGGLGGSVAGTGQGTDLGGPLAGSLPVPSGSVVPAGITPSTAGTPLAGAPQDQPAGGLPDVPGVTTGSGPLAGTFDGTDVPDVSGVTGRSGPLPDLSPAARAAGLPDYSGLGGLPDVAGLAGGRSTGPTTVNLQGKSGVNGTATIDENRVRGQATGLNPNARYVSFFYGATSSATNNNPCIIDGTNPVPAGQTVGQWKVDQNGNGTLDAPNPDGNLYKLTAGTMSIRQVQHGFSSPTAVPLNPLSYSLASCGAVNRVSTVDPVTNAVPQLPTGNVPKLPYVSGPGLSS